MTDSSNTPPENIVPLRLAEPSPSQEMIELAENLLERVRRGEVLAFAVAMHTRADGTGTAYSIDKGGDVAHLVCSMERMKMRLLEHGS